MAKNKISDWSNVPSNNTDVGDINIAEGCAPSNINNALREIMAQVKDMQTGADADNFVVGGAMTCTGAAVFSSTVAIGTPLAVTSGGTGLATLAAGDILYAGGTNTLAKLATASTTTSVLLSGNTAPTWGKVALASAVSGTLPIVNGGTGQTTASDAINALVPTQTSNSGKYLKTDGTSVSWQDVAAGGVGTVTSVAPGSGMNFTTIETTGTVTMGTPSTLTTSSINEVTALSHTHAINFPVSSVRGQTGDTALASGNIVLTDLASFAKSLNSNGYQKLPGGLIIQWGNASISSTTTVISFTTAFTTACYSIIAIPYLANDAGGVGSAIAISSGPTKTGCILSTDVAQTALYYIAIGQ